MKKIYILVGLILLFIFFLGSWIIIEFEGFASFLGEESRGIDLYNKSMLVGSWETEFIENDKRFIGYNGVYTFSINGNAIIGGIDCSWDINEDNLTITIVETLEINNYNYVFSNNESIVTLTNRYGSFNLTKKSIE